MKTEVTPRLKGIKRVAEDLGVSIWTLRQWAYTGKISSHKLGNRLMISPEEIDRIVRESERPRLAGSK
jgi:excisionase family DNA binding protein